MTTWVNAGAVHAAGGGYVKTKAELKRLLKSAPQSVAFVTTGQFPNQDFEVLASDLGNRPGHLDEAWTIVGPDPYNKRVWYATVRTNHLGTLKVT